jgi:hypothetical protein
MVNPIDTKADDNALYQGNSPVAVVPASPEGTESTERPEDTDLADIKRIKYSFTVIF